MARIVPSQAVQVIDTLFAHLKDQNDSKEGRVSLHPGDAGNVQAVLDVLDEIPSELLALGPAEYARFSVAASVLRNQVLEWNLRGNTGKLERIRGFGDLNPMTIVRRALAQCKDEPVYANSDELDFIPDADLRESIWIDITAVRRAMANQEWKAATVLAGAAIEALLLFALSAKPTAEIANATKQLVASGALNSNPDSNIQKWNLNEYIHVSSHLGLITDSGKTQMLLAKDFRNLIHPGKSVRLGQVCDRGTAFTAVAAVEHALRDLKKAV